MDYKRHKFNIYPKIQDEQYNELKQSIKNGYDDTFPIIIYYGKVSDGEILDGWNRYQICKEVNVTPIFKEFIGNDEEALEFVVKSNKRRDLTQSQRAVLAVEYEALFIEEAKKKQREAGISGIKGKEYGKEGGRGNKKEQNPLQALIPEGGFGDEDIQEEPEPVKKPAPQSRDKAASMMGVSGKYVSEAKKIKEESPEKIQEILDGKKTITKVKQEIRNEKLKNNKCELPEGKYNVIYIDPPWEYSNSGFKMSAENQYPTMPVDKIKDIPIQNITSENAIIFCWVTNPLLQEGLEIIKHWGFKYKTNICWVKNNHTAGFYVYGKHELLLIGVKGNQMTPHGEKIKSVVYDENHIHSKKPEIFYKIIEEMFPNFKYIEIFARSKREGWDSWGNEIEG